MESKASLVRQLGLASATAYVVSNMIGTGIFGATGFFIADLGQPNLVFLLWIVGAVCALAGAWCYGELGINFPSSGGEYVYLSQQFGPTWGFVSGWVSFFAGFSAPVAAAAISFSNYLGYLNPALKDDHGTAIQVGWMSFNFGGAQLVACGLILILTVLNLFGIGFIGKIQNGLTATKIGVLALFIVMALTVGTGDWGHLQQTIPGKPDLGAAFAVSLFWVYASYSGWNAATYVAEEIENPRKTLPMALTLGTILVTVFYLLLNAIFFYAIPLDKMAGDPAVGSTASLYLFGDNTAKVLSLLMALGLMSTVNAMLTIAPRVYYAMAKNGAFLSAAAYVHPEWRTPVWAILAQGAMACIFTLTSLKTLLSYIGFTLNIFAALAVAALFFFRKREGWQKLPIVSFAWPLVPGIFLLISGWSAIYGFYQQPKEAAIGVGTILVGALVYHFVVAKRVPARV
jgi:basic amino acid/polyamine antiporter, APA family